MPFDIYTTRRLLMAVQGIDEAPSFLRDRYFPHTAADVFSTEKVLVEYRDGDRRLAPFVVNGSPVGMNVSRAGQKMYEYEPPTIMPERPITHDDIVKRGFGEALYGDNITPEQRANLLAIRDLEELSNMIARREEAMASETMRDNGCKMYAYVDTMEPTLVDEVHFYEGSSNPAKVTITTDWDEADADILGDMWSMIRMLTQEGLAAEDLVVAPDVADAIINNETIQKLLDNRRYELGEVRPVQIPANAGAYVACTLNIYGHMINVIGYDRVYKDDKGKMQQYMPAGTAVLTAPGAGRTLYGAVSQVEQADGEFHTYTGERVPKYVANARQNVRTLALTSRPLMAPNDKNPFIFSQVISQD